MKRLENIDIMRGLVMVIMALDHTRDMMHVTSLTQSPTDLATTSPALFFTRWITHLCAPVFVFLSGVSAGLSMARKNDLAASRKFLLTRGVWLIVLEFTLVNFGLWFDLHFSVFLFNVIATIGFGFIVLGLSLKLRPALLGWAGLLIVSLHNIFPMLPLADGSLLKNILMPFFLPIAYPIGAHTSFVMGYPPIPWLGVMLMGFGAARFFELSIDRRKIFFYRAGAAALLLFAVLRFLNVYGDPVPWAKQHAPEYTFLSFFNVTKYPPSLLFCLLMLGIMFLLLGMLDGIKNKCTDLLRVYGKVPLFYFLVHWYIIHPLMFAMVFLQGFTRQDLVFGFNFGRPKQGSGVGLWVIYLIWIGVVVVLYPVCKAYGQYKSAHPEKKWLRYL